MNEFVWELFFIVASCFVSAASYFLAYICVTSLYSQTSRHSFPFYLYKQVTVHLLRLVVLQHLSLAGLHVGVWADYAGPKMSWYTRASEHAYVEDIWDTPEMHSNPCIYMWDPQFQSITYGVIEISFLLLKFGTVLPRILSVKRRVVGSLCKAMTMVVHMTMAMVVHIICLIVIGLPVKLNCTRISSVDS